MNSLGTLDALVGRMKSHPDYSHNIFCRVQAALREDALSHSIRMEGINSFLDNSPETYLCEQSKRTFRVAFDGSLAGIKYLEEMGITLTSLSSLGWYVENSSNKFKTVRTSEVLFGEFSGAKPSEILYKLNDLCSVLKDENLHPVRKAIEAHVELVSIHPYSDGNGRSARILQDYLLESAGYPCPIISEGEKGIYLKLMSSLMRDRKNRNSTIYSPSETQIIFEEYIIGKVISSALHLEKELHKNRVYEIELQGNYGQGCFQTLRSKLRKQISASSSDGAIVKLKERGKKKKTPIIVVQGNITRQEIEGVLKSTKFVEHYSILPRSVSVIDD